MKQKKVLIAKRKRFEARKVALGKRITKLQVLEDRLTSKLRNVSTHRETLLDAWRKLYSEIERLSAEIGN